MWLYSSDCMCYYLRTTSLLPRHLLHFSSSSFFSAAIFLWSSRVTGNVRDRDVHCTVTVIPGDWVSLHYIAGTMDHGITLDASRSANELVAFADAEFANLDLDTRRSYGAFCIYFAGGPVAWNVARYHPQMSLQ